MTDPTDPAAPPARDGGPAMPDIPEELYAAWSPSECRWDLSEIDEEVRDAYQGVVPAYPSASQAVPGENPHWQPVLIGVHPRHRERADRLAALLREVADEWPREGFPADLARRVDEALEGEGDV